MQQDQTREAPDRTPPDHTCPERPAVSPHILADAKLDWLQTGPKTRTPRRAVFETIEIGHGEDRASQIFDAVIVTLIVLNVAAMIAETVPSI